MIDPSLAMGMLLGLFFSYISKKLWQSQPKYSPWKVSVSLLTLLNACGCISKTEPRGSNQIKNHPLLLGCNAGVPQGSILEPRLFSCDIQNSLTLAEELISKCMQTMLLFMTQQAASWRSDDRHMATCHTMPSNVETVKWTGKWNVPD